MSEQKFARPTFGRHGMVLHRTVVRRQQMLGFISRQWKKYEASVRDLGLEGQLNRIHGRTLKRLEGLGAPEQILANERERRRRLVAYMNDGKAARQAHKEMWLKPLPDDFPFGFGAKFIRTASGGEVEYRRV